LNAERLAVAFVCHRPQPFAGKVSGEGRVRFIAQRAAGDDLPKSPSIGIIGALRHFEVNAALWMPPEEGVESGAHLPEGFPRSQIIVNLQHQITLSFDQPHGGVASGVGAGEGADGAQHRAAPITTTRPSGTAAGSVTTR